MHLVKVLIIYYPYVTEAQQALLSVITSMKETISDPEKHMGRFTREDKVCLSCIILFNFFSLF